MEEKLEEKNELESKVVDLQTLALILRRMPQSLLQLKIDELIATHIVKELESLGIEFDSRAFLSQALVDEHWRDIQANGVLLDRHYDSEYRYRKEYYQCKVCKSKYVTTLQLQEHDCKPKAPIIQRGRTLVNLDKL